MTKKLLFLLLIAMPTAAQTLAGGRLAGGTMGGTAASSSAAQVNTTTLVIGLNRGANSAPAFSSNYTTSNWTEASGSMTINHTGSNSFSPTTPLSITVGQTYEVDLVCSAYTSGTFTVSLGGFTTPVVTPAASNQYRFYVTASSTANISVSAATTGAQAFAFSSLTVKRAAFDPTSLANIPVIVDTNTGLSVPLTVYEPPALNGWTFQEYVIALFAVVDKTANGTDTWEWGTSTYTNSMTFAAVRQTFFTLVSYANGFWDVSGVNGSITPA